MADLSHVSAWTPDLTCWVYVLESLTNGRLYVGTTTRLARRLREHNAGHTKSTAGARSYRLLTKERFNNHCEARIREKFLKSGQGRQFIREHIRQADNNDDRHEQ